jgi:cation diffusion facilitator CzcD-associated flavoprotein CzcO
MIEPLTDADIARLRERYRIERDKRLRPDGNRQYRELAGEYEEFDRDPYTEWVGREPVVRQTEVLVVGGGFGGMLTAIGLTKLGITDFCLVEKGGDFGGTWYWNRYPGCMCDVESYTYLPLLEETGYMPRERYASATEIFDYCRLLGRHFDLYDRSLFQTVIEGAVWDESTSRWQVTTDRGDQIAARFVVVAGGILHKAKLPGIPGIEAFNGKAFHTSRWDYSYTGGSPSTPMDQLSGKRVGIIGTGATAVQVVPKLAAAAGELFVFQRTPSAVGVRNQAPTDATWFQDLQPGWQRERITNFTQSVTGVQPAQNLVDDGWTDVMWVNTQRAPETPQEAEELEISDLTTMEVIRRRVDEIVLNPETAEKLKPYWGKNCKRVCFHDDYLPAFNLPNVHLVDTDGQGVQRVTEGGVVVDGVEYPVDMLVFASGFEVTTDFDHRVGFDPIGRDGLSLSKRWAEGARTMHGVLQADFPNLMLISLTQGGFGTNFAHFLAGNAAHCAAIVATCRDQGIETIEATPEAEEDWLMVLYGAAGSAAVYAATCTPSFYNSEQQAPDAKAARNLVYAGSLLDYLGHLDRWREAGDLAGTKILKRRG